MRIVIAPDKFKEALSAQAAAEAIARGVRRIYPEAVLALVPMADGGEGTAEALVAATGGSWREVAVHGPLGEMRTARFGLLGSGHSLTRGNTPDRDEATHLRAVLEMAEASGLAWVPADRRDPRRTTTLGTGELIRAALDAGATEILVGIGGSATTDGGTGAAQAVGVRFIDRQGHELPAGMAGGQLANLARIDTQPRDPRVAAARILAACDVDNPLCGPHGAAAVYGPQKGASPEAVAELDAGLTHLAAVIERDLGLRIADLPGAGAAGGLGAGLVAFFGATLTRGIKLVMSAVGLAERIAGADLVITGEGRLDGQSARGKVVVGVAEAARAAGVPVVALVGALGEHAEDAVGRVDRCVVINPPGESLPAMLARAAERLEAAAREVVSSI